MTAGNITSKTAFPMRIMSFLFDPAGLNKTVGGKPC